MRVQTKLIFAIVPVLSVCFFLLGVFSYYTARNLMLSDVFRNIDAVLDSRIEHTFQRRSNLLRSMKMDTVASFVAMYQQEALADLRVGSDSKFGCFVVFDEKNINLFSSPSCPPMPLQGQFRDSARHIRNAATHRQHGQTADGVPNVFGVRYFKPWDWVLIYSVETSSFETGIYQIFLWTFGLASLSVAVCAFVIVFVFRRVFGEPVQRLRTAAARIANRESNVVIDVGSKDELGELAASLADMAKATSTHIEQLEKSEKSLIQATTAGNVGLWDWDLGTGRVSYSPVWKRQIGYEEGEIDGRYEEFERRLHPDDLAHTLSALKAAQSPPWPPFKAEFRLRHKDGSYRWIWATGAFLFDEQMRPVHMMGAHVDITERKQSEDRIQFLAFHDLLTELPNRMLVQDRFNQAIAYADRSHSKVALLFLDLDNFKTINDSLGHLIGDELLKEVAKRLIECARDTDTISRQGGDEFLIVLPDLPDAEAATPVLEKLINRLSDPYVIAGNELTTSASIGVTFYPDDGNDFESLLKKSDIAMYRAKESGRNAYRFFDNQMNVDAVEKQFMLSGLRKALARSEFVLHYQPQIDLASGRIIGVEALLRWNHPELGMIPPARFISIAEDSGLIVPIGEWVLREACRQAACWQDSAERPLTVAVNLSAVQFRRGNIEESVIAALEESGLNPALIELEITESILIGDTDKVLDTIQTMKSLGIKLSIDDFGTGYSSLSYLKRFQVDKLKIDQSFVRNLGSDVENAAIVRAIIQMARSLGLTTLAEGVEDEKALARLRDFGCDEAQGYYFARPMPNEELLAFKSHRGNGTQQVMAHVGH